MEKHRKRLMQNLTILYSYLNTFHVAIQSDHSSKFSSYIHSFKHHFYTIPMEINPKSYAAFFNGVSSYEKMHYQNSAEHFLAGISNQKTFQSPQDEKAQLNPLNNLCSSLHQPPFEFLSNLSSCLIKTKKYQQATQIFSYLFKLNPYMSLPYYNMASIYIRQQKYTEATGMIKCAISCEFLRKYERMFDREALDMAIQYAGNNLNARKYRIAHNLQYLNFVKKMSSIEYDLSEQVQKALKQLQTDNTSYNAYKKIYDIKFYDKNQSQNKKFFILTIKPQFVLENQQSLPDQGDCNVEKKLALMKQLKQLRDMYLQLLQANECQMDFALLIEEFAIESEIKIDCQDIEINDQDRSQKSIYQNFDLKNIIDSASSHHSFTFQTSCELHDSCQAVVPPKSYKVNSTCCTIKTNKKRDQNYSRIKNRPSTPPNLNISGKSHSKNIRKTSLTTQNITKNKENVRLNQQPKHNNYLNKTSLISLRNKSSRLYPNQLPVFDNSKNINEAPEEQELKTSRNKLPTPQKFSNPRKDSCQLSCQSASHDKDNLNSSIISILDYNDGSSHFGVNQNCQQRASIVESIIVHAPKESREHDQCHTRHSVNHMEFQLIKNRSHENLFASNILSDVTKKLSHSRFQNQNVSLMIDSKSHMKILSCSKCSIDHTSAEETLTKNTRLNINLTEVYNFPGDYSQLQTFCVVKHMGQTYRNELSKGKFPNWRHPISLHVQNLDHISQQSEQQRTIKIQLWAKSINHKKDLSNQSLYSQQMVGEQSIDLRDEKWIKRKLFLGKGLKKTAYMYISMEKIKE